MPAAHLLKELGEVSSRLWAARDLEEGLREMLAATVRLLDADKGNVQLYVAASGVLMVVAQQGFDEAFLEFFREVSLDAETCCGRAIRLKRRVVIEDVELDAGFAPYLAAARAAGFRGVQSTPLISRVGERLGVMSTHFDAPRPLGPEELDCLDVYARQAADFVERIRFDDRLRRSEERLRALVKASSYSIYRLNRDWTEMHEIDGAHTLADASAPSRDWLQSHICPDDRPAVEQAIREACEARRMFEMEHRVRRADGTIGWARSRAVPIKDAADEIVEWFGAATDITAQKSFETALQEETRRKDEFLAILAHELRNPLAALHSAFTASSRMDASANAARLQGVIGRQMRQLIRLVDDLLDVSRISTGNFRIETQQVDLAAMIRQAIETSGPSIDEKRLRLNLSLGEDPLIVDGDRIRLAQAIANLVDNAAKFTLVGGRVDVRLTRDGADAVIEVRDDGVGIPPERLPHIFDLFVRSEHAGDGGTRGLGVGLALVRKLVLLHGGRVDGMSDGIDRGSRFLVRLPLTATAAGEGPPSAAGASLPPRKVLILDDDRDVADSLALLLGAMGASARATYSGAEALAALTEVDPHVIFVDIGMPEMDGYATARALRARPEGLRAVLVALSGWGEANDRRRSKDAGFDFHIVKPIEVVELERLLGAAPAPK